MENFRIYLAGAMGGMTYREYNGWRANMKVILESLETCYKVICCNPSSKYNYEQVNHDSEREIMEYELHKVKTSDLVIVNLKNHGSLGTMAEITTAYLNGIPVIGLNDCSEEIHPWQKEMCLKIFENFHDMINYVREYFLND